MDKLRNSTLDALRPSQAQRSLKEMMRVRCEWDFFKNVYRNVRKAYFDRRTTQSEFWFEMNILCDRRSVQWRTMKVEVRKTALQNNLTLKLVNKQPSGFRFHQVLRCFRVVLSQFWTTSKYLSAPETTTDNQRGRSKSKFLTSDWPIFWSRVIPGLYKEHSFLTLVKYFCSQSL